MALKLATVVCQLHGLDPKPNAEPVSTRPHRRGAMMMVLWASVVKFVNIHFYSYAGLPPPFRHSLNTERGGIRIGDLDEVRANPEGD